MGRIGVLTFHFPKTKNFGAHLQTYAGMTLLKKFDKNVQIINYEKPEIKVSFLKRAHSYLETRGFNEFSKKFFSLTSKVKNFEELSSLNQKIDKFVVGSDQIWRVAWKGEIVHNSHYFLDFVKNEKKKISYAASFGVDNWEGNEETRKEISSLLQRFDFVSVREEGAITLCNEYLGRKDVVCVLDPTLMINKTEYKPILDDWTDKSHLKKKYIAHMLLDDTEELRSGSKKIADYLEANINYIKGKYQKILWKQYFKYNKVSQWLTYLKDAELVITDSFHCTVFSIIFHKKFVVVANPIRGIARLETLLGKLGLEDRFFTNIDEVLKSGVLDKEIDYEEVDKKLEVHRKYSMEFLKKALED